MKWIMPAPSLARARTDIVVIPISDEAVNKAIALRQTAKNEPGRFYSGCHLVGKSLGIGVTKCGRFQNVRGTFLCSRLCLPHLQKSDHAHVLTMAPPLSLEAKWFAGHAAYTVSKFGMAMMTFGIAAEFSECGIAFNCLWPKTIIKTAALAMIPGIDTNG
jgi:hypothetical protein